MAKYLVIDADWLERAIRDAETLREHAQSSGKAVAIAAAGIRLESLKEIRRRAAPAAAVEGDGPIRITLERPPEA